MLSVAAVVLEVMDKEWPLWQVLAFFLGIGIVGLLLCRRWPLMVIVILPLITMFGIGQITELADPYVGEAIKHEAGIRYVVLSYLAIGSSFVLLVVGTLHGWRRRKAGVKSCQVG